MWQVYPELEAGCYAQPFTEIFLDSTQHKIIFASCMTGTLCLHLLLYLGCSHHLVVSDGEHWQLDRATRNLDLETPWRPVSGQLWKELPRLG